LEKVAIDMTGNKRDMGGNSRLMSFGVESQGFSVEKADQQILINMFGLTLGSYSKFKDLYKFGMRTNNTIKAAAEQLQGEINQEQYVLDMREAIEIAKTARPRSINGSQNDATSNGGRSNSQFSNQMGVGQRKVQMDQGFDPRNISQQNLNVPR